MRPLKPFADRVITHAISKFVYRSTAPAVKKPIKHIWGADIAIDRDPGSGGHPVAEKVANKLGWQLLDKKILTELADHFGIPRREFVDVDERPRPWLMDVIHSVFNPDYISDIRYVNHLKKLLLAASKKGDVVIIGHGANHILPPDKCLRVRVTASMPKRVENTFTFENKKSREEARAWVEQVESKRVSFIRQYFRANPYNPWHYDIIVSTDHLTLDQATDLIIQAYYAKFPAAKQKVKTRH